MQVLELGIVVHSVIIGISLGASQDPDTIKPLVVALSFHQMFEGMGLGGCIVQVESFPSIIAFIKKNLPIHHYILSRGSGCFKHMSVRRYMFQSIIFFC